MGLMSLFAGLYGAFVGLQAMDAHSTLRALKNGARETNPLLGPVLNGNSDPATPLLAAKALATGTVIGCSELARRTNPNASANLMIAINAIYAGVVAHNYLIPDRRGALR